LAQAFPVFLLGVVVGVLLASVELPSFCACRCFPWRRKVPPPCKGVQVGCETRERGVQAEPATKAHAIQTEADEEEASSSQAVFPSSTWGEQSLPWPEQKRERQRARVELVTPVSVNQPAPPATTARVSIPTSSGLSPLTGKKTRTRVNHE
jgi:hypothetical protein